MGNNITPDICPPYLHIRVMWRPAYVCGMYVIPPARRRPSTVYMPKKGFRGKNIARTPLHHRWIYTYIPSNNTPQNSHEDPF